MQLRSRAPCSLELFLLGSLLPCKCRPVWTSLTLSHIVHVGNPLTHRTRKLPSWLYCDLSRVSRSQPVLPTEVLCDLKVLMTHPIHCKLTVRQAWRPFPASITISIFMRLNTLPWTQRQAVGEPESKIRSHTPKSSVFLFQRPDEYWYLICKMRRDGACAELGTRLKGPQISSQPRAFIVVNLANMDNEWLNCSLLNIS